MKHRFALLVLSVCLLVIISSGSDIFASEPDELIIVKPFGSSAKVPDPAKGSDGWYMSEAGMTETLFVLDFDMNLKPWLAESFKNISPLTWEIRLRKGVRFHDNTLMDASAVTWSVDRLINEKSEVFNKRMQGLLDIRTLTVRDSHTLIFETSKPNAAFLYDLTSPETAIISPGSNKDKIYGTGPFVSDKVIPNEQMIVSGFDK